MHRLQLIVNKQMRLEGFKDSGIKPGSYVIADNLTIVEEIGSEFEADMIAARPKAILVDFVSGETKTCFDLESPDGLEIMTKANAGFNPKFGAFYGAELLIQIHSNFPLLTWFFCTDNMRPLLDTFKCGSTCRVTSRELASKKTTFWTPRVEVLNAEANMLGYYNAIRDFMEPVKHLQV